MNYLKFFLLLFLLFDCLRSHVEASVQLNKFGIEFILDIQYWILKEPISKFLTSRSLVVRLRGKVKRNALLLVSRKAGAAGAQFFLEGTKVSTRQLFRFYLFFLFSDLPELIKWKLRSFYVSFAKCACRACVP